MLQTQDQGWRGWLTCVALTTGLAGTGCDRVRAFIHDKTAPAQAPSSAVTPAPVAAPAAAPAAAPVAAVAPSPAVAPAPMAPSPDAAAAPAVAEVAAMAVQPLEPLVVRARKALAEVGIALGDDALVEQGQALQVTLEASAATDYDRQLLTQWALCFGTLGPLCADEVRIVNTVGGTPAVRVDRQARGHPGAGKRRDGYTKFSRRLKIERLLPALQPLVADPPLPRFARPPAPRPQPMHPRPIRQEPRPVSRPGQAPRPVYERPH